MSSRIAIASIYQETNSFSPIPMTLADFESRYLFRGEEMLTGFRDDRVEIPGFLSVITAADATIVPLVVAMALAGGPVARATFENLMREIEGGLKEQAPIDGIYLALHGALAIEDEPDGDGEILERVRRIIPAAAPIGVSLDMHAHVTGRMLQPNTFLIGYQEYPHTDIFETGQRVARLLLDTLAGRRRPVMAITKRPLVLSAAFTRTSDGPLKAVAEAARLAEAVEPTLHVSLFPVQPWLDVPDLGFGVLVCADGNLAEAERVANTMGDMVWGRRREFEPDLVSLAESIRIGLSAPGLTVVSDSGDSPSAGSSADSTAVLQALFDQDAQRSTRLSYLTLHDPGAVESAVTAGVGEVISFDAGHCFTTNAGKPLRVTGRVRSISDGIYRMREPDIVMNMGRSAVLEIGAIRLVLRSLAAVEWDPELYRSQGLDPDEASLIFVKSPSAFRLAYAPIAARILIADTPGPSCANIRRIPYERVTRPLYPLDEM